MRKNENNFAFIDGQNLNLGIKKLGWKIDFRRFRKYLMEKYSVVTAYYFIGYVPGNQPLYSELQKAGFVLVFKPTIPGCDGSVKGNIDADLVLQAMIDLDNYDFALIVSSDGDFYSLVKYLYQNKKLRFVMSPYIETCSTLLKREAKEKIVFMVNLRARLEYK
ncbi:MAG: NYN domain-containing protein [Patescibacteria group bacterium]